MYTNYYVGVEFAVWIVYFMGSGNTLLVKEYNSKRKNNKYD